MQKPSDDSGAGAGRLLSELIALTPDQRELRLRAEHAPAESLWLLADEVERIAMTEVARGLEASDVVLGLCERFGGAREHAHALRARAQSLAYAGRYEESLDPYAQSSALAEQAGETLESAQARISSLHALASLGRYDDAIHAGETAREAFAALGRADLAARADVNLGAAHQMRDDPASAVRHLNRARPHFLADPVTLAKVDSNRGHALVNLDDFEAAEAAFLASLPVFEERGLHWAAATVEGNLAELSARQGRLQKAFYHYERALRHMEADAAGADAARLRAEQADAYAIVGLHADAARVFEAAIPELERHGLAFEAVRARAGLGLALLRLRRVDDAAEPLTRAAGDFRRLGHETAASQLDLSRAELALARGQSAEARDILISARHRLLERPASVAVADYLLARAHIVANDPRTAADHLARAVSFAEQIGLAPLLADLYRLRGSLQRENGRTADSVDSFRRAAEQIERVRGTLQAERFRAAFHGSRIGAYEDLVTATLDLDRPESVADAFEAIERAKSRALLELASAALESPDAHPTTGDPAETALIKQMERSRARLSTLYSRLADDVGLRSAKSAPDYHGEILLVEQELRDIESRVATTRGTAGLFSPPIQLDAAQRLLSPDAALIEYFIAGDELLAIVAGTRSARVFRRLCSADQVAETVERAAFQIQRALRPGATDGSRGSRLLADARRELSLAYDRLVRPLAEALDGVRRVIVTPHGRLHALPFSALFDGQRSWIESVQLRQSPSASLLALLASRRPPTNQISNATVVGVSDAAAPLIEDEAVSVSRALGAARVLLGADATVQRVTDAAADADVLHWACHGNFSHDNPNASGLKLADRWFGLRDAFDLRLCARLVTLSGCETGRAAVAGGDELLGLIRGFIAAGAGALLVSLWKVNDLSTTELMTAFYHKWRRPSDNSARPSAAAALQAAQLELMRSRPHPTFWAPFILIGDA